MTHETGDDFKEVVDKIEDGAQRIFFIKKSNWLLAKRMAARSVFLLVLTMLGFHFADLLIDSARFGTLPIMRRFPDIVALFTAAAKFTFIEMSLFWIRFSTSPKLDVQEVAATASITPVGAAIVHAVNTLQWAMRFGIFLYLLQG